MVTIIPKVKPFNNFKDIKEEFENSPQMRKPFANNNNSDSEIFNGQEE